MTIRLATYTIHFAFVLFGNIRPPFLFLKETSQWFGPEFRHSAGKCITIGIHIPTQKTQRNDFVFFQININTVAGHGIEEKRGREPTGL